MLVPHAGFILGLISSNLQMVVAVWSRAKNLFVSYQCSTLLLFEGPLHRIWKFALTLHVQDCSFLDSGHIFHAGHASVHVREPVRAWHAGDDAGGAPGHHLEVLDDQVRKNLCAELPGFMEQGFACIPGSLCVYRPVSYDKPLAWRGRCSLTIAACTTSASCLSTGRLVLHLVDIGRFKRGRTR